MKISRWRIIRWSNGDLPRDLFREDGDLLILREGEEGPDAYTYVWVNAREKLCWIESLPELGRAKDKEVQGWGENPISISDVNIVHGSTGPREGTPGRSIMTCTLHTLGSGTGEPGTVTVESSSPPPPGGPPGKP